MYLHQNAIICPNKLTNYGVVAYSLTSMAVIRLISPIEPLYQDIVMETFTIRLDRSTEGFSAGTWVP